MNFIDILLILVSSAGLLHGIAFAIYLCFVKKKKMLTNYLLGSILIFMAFRIGKSVMKNFGDDLEPVFIFAGLAMLLLIGPLLRWYMLGMTRPGFVLTRRHATELIPFVLVFVSSLFITKAWFDANTQLAIVLFSTVLISIYLHLLGYIILAGKIWNRVNKELDTDTMTKSKKAILEWLRWVLIGFVVIWISYVFNILDDTVPYIVGPIVYSLAIYFLSYKAYQLQAIELDGEAFKPNENRKLYQMIYQKVVEEKLYLDADLTLSRVSQLVGESNQKTSLAINQFSNRNFNDFINYYRIEEVKQKLMGEEKEKYTISSLAFDVGFSSLSSFNSAFKKFVEMTPSAFRKLHEN